MLHLYLNNKLLAEIPFVEPNEAYGGIRNFLQGQALEEFYLVHNGGILREGDALAGDTVHVVARLRGGKGGFGSMLRAIGAQIEKTTNREACRDLSGRRLRDINEEKRLKKWLGDQAEREKDAAEKKKKKLERLAYEPKHEFTDAQYDKVRSEMVDKVHSAVEQGLQAASASSAEGSGPSTSAQGVKRKPEATERKKGMLWLEEELGSDLSDSEEEEEDCKRVKVA